MNSLIFGATSSSCSALYVQRRNAEEYVIEMPEAAVSIIQNSYVDDYLCSRNSLETTKKLIAEVIRINASGNFELHSWASNSSEAISIKPEYRSEVINKIALKKGPKERVLGMTWDTSNDILRFNIDSCSKALQILRQPNSPTKREFLRVIMSIFDPLGLIAAFTVQGKMLLQRVWRNGIGWDESLKLRDIEKWLHWVEQLRTIQSIVVPRCISSQKSEAPIELHVFCDASEVAYATVVYTSCQSLNSGTHVSLVMGRAKVAPLKPITIPRLELQAALIGSRLLKAVTLMKLNCQ
ncbi:uncharacterized protein [Prorops nasuta]|uniref:uncharacterized protein n=1 Tax=Prorops nasuta TaxID=863751 RepID=UPI0034CDC5CF